MVFKEENKHCCQEERARVLATVILHAGSTQHQCSAATQQNVGWLVSLSARTALVLVSVLCS